MRNHSSKARLAAIAARQKGRVTWAQIRSLEVDRAVVSRWLADGYLHRRLPRVYAVGHAGTSYEASLTEALLYAGPGAMLSHATAAHWLGLLNERPRQIHVGTPRQTHSQPGITVHTRRLHDRTWHNGLPTSTLPQLFLDLAATMPLPAVRLALARADYRGILQVPDIEAAVTPGRPGSARLRAALAEHQPKLAYTSSELERRWIELCEQAGFPIPETNERIAGWLADVVWHDVRLVVELDGYDNHRSPAQVRRDRRKELDIRAAGFGIVRYSGEQVFKRPHEVIADIRRLRGADILRGAAPRPPEP